jgi:hypothetical protein
MYRAGWLLRVAKRLSENKLELVAVQVRWDELVWKLWIRQKPLAPAGN